MESRICSYTEDLFYKACAYKIISTFNKLMENSSSLETELEQAIGGKSKPSWSILNNNGIYWKFHIIFKVNYKKQEMWMKQL